MNLRPSILGAALAAVFAMAPLEPVACGAVQVSLLGPVRVEIASGEVVIAAAKERALLTALALNPGRAVGIDVLVDALWGDAPPVTARKTLQTYVMNWASPVEADT